MKKIFFLYLFILINTLTGCEIIGGIFKAGMGVGIFLVVIVVAIILFILSKFRNRS